MNDTKEKFPKQLFFKNFRINIDLILSRNNYSWTPLHHMYLHSTMSWINKLEATEESKNI